MLSGVPVGVPVLPSKYIFSKMPSSPCVFRKPMPVLEMWRTDYPRRPEWVRVVRAPVKVTLLAIPTCHRYIFQIQFEPAEGKAMTIHDDDQISSVSEYFLHWGKVAASLSER